MGLGPGGDVQFPDPIAEAGVLEQAGEVPADLVETGEFRTDGEDAVRIDLREESPLGEDRKAKYSTP
jgi:hypothetical protein